MILLKLTVANSFDYTKPMASTILGRGLPICGLRPYHVCEQVDDFFNSAYRSFETWFIFYKMNCQSNAKTSEKVHDLPRI
jgi:hypothetical protein